MNGSEYLESKAAVEAGNGNKEWPQTVKLINAVLIDWKATTLPGLLQKSSPGLLTYLSVKLERSLPKYDSLIKETKYLVVAAPGQAAPPKKALEDALKMAHIWEERKAIMIAILGSVKLAEAQWALTGG